MQKDQRYKINKTVYTVEGTLYKDEIVKFVQREDGHYRVKDSMGKIWFVNKDNLRIFI